MRNHSIKFILFLVAFIIGTIAAFLFLQKKLSLVEVKNASNVEQVNQSDKPQSAQTSPLNSLFFDGYNHGCGDFIAYKSTKDNTKVIGISADKNSLKLGKIPKTFDISNNKNLNVFLYDFGEDGNAARSYAGLCTGSINADLRPIVLIAKSGKATVSISVSPKDFLHSYKVKVILENISFQTPNKTTINIEKIEIKDVTAGIPME